MLEHTQYERQPMWVKRCCLYHAAQADEALHSTAQHRQRRISTVPSTQPHGHRTTLHCRACLTLLTYASSSRARAIIGDWRQETDSIPHSLTTLPPGLADSHRYRNFCGFAANLQRPDRGSGPPRPSQAGKFCRAPASGIMGGIEWHEVRVG